MFPKKTHFSIHVERNYLIKINKISLCSHTQNYDEN